MCVLLLFLHLWDSGAGILCFGSQQTGWSGTCRVGGLSLVGISTAHPALPAAFPISLFHCCQSLLNSLPHTQRTKAETAPTKPWERHQQVLGAKTPFCREGEQNP